MRKVYMLIAVLFLCQLGFAQQMTITGVVNATDDDYPIVGANVLIKGTKVGTITDFDGNFSIQASVGSIIQVSYLGYASQEIKVTKAGPIDFLLEPDNTMLDEVVAIGYGTVKKSDLTGAVSSVSGEKLKATPVSSLDQALQGRAAGVTVNANSGQPGEAATVRIRGIGSAVGSSDPIYVVDGIILDNISFLNPNDIVSTEVLKDASATAIYGSRGANGVIIVTTRMGQKGKTRVSFDAYWGIQNRWKKLDLMGSEEMADTKLRINAMSNGASEIAYYQQNGFNEWMQSYNLGSASYYAVAKTAATPNGLDYASIDTDWQDELFNANALMQNYNISVDGGSETTVYSFSTSYFQQEGTIMGSDYDRLTLRFNSESTISKWFKFGEHVSIINSASTTAMNNSSSPGASIISAAIAMAPWDPTRYPEGTVNSSGEDISGQIAAATNFKNTVNPLSMVENSYTQNNWNRFVGDLYVVVNPIKDLTWRTSVSVDYSINEYKLYKDEYEYSSYDFCLTNFISSSIYRYQTLMEESTLTYAKDFGKHSISAMIGQTAEEYSSYGIGGSGSTILNPVETNWYLNQATEDQSTAGDAVSQVRRLSFISRVHYSYNDKYMITANFRADGSSKFTNNPWGYFPSTALAWRINQESFMSGLRNIDNLKLRLGWGRVGNDDVSTTAFMLNMYSDQYSLTGYSFGDELVTGSTVLTYCDTDGKWETNEQWSAGIDFGFWNGLLYGSVDVYRRDTKDALLYINAPAQVGNRYSMVSNVGVIRNEGIEIQLDHSNKIGEVSYSLGGNVSFLRNELTESNGGFPLYGDRTITQEGYAINTFWGYVYEGIYQTDDEALEHLDGYTSETISVGAGDAKYSDLNDDGIIDDNDKTDIGNPFPWLTYGFNVGAEWKGFDVQIFFQGVYGNEIYNALRERTEGTGSEATLSSTMSDVWVGYSQTVQTAMMNAGVNYTTLENLDGTIPNPNGSPMNSETSSRLIESGAYLRLKNIQIGYTLPKRLTQKAKIEKCRFYISANNLLTFTNYSGYDPEISTGVDYGNYPQSRTFTFGFNVNL
ncbi:MAG: TonB-dependent receptor [bacterium]